MPRRRTLATGILPCAHSDADIASQSLLRLSAYAGSRGIGSPEPPSIRNACICWRAFLSVYFSGYWLVAFATGDKVVKGQALAVMEAMKMEHTIAAPADGTVAELLYAPGDQVAEGAELLKLEMSSSK